MTSIDETPFAEDVRAVAAHYGVRETEVEPAPTQGQVNLTVFLAAELVLRIPRTPRAQDLLRKESEIIPVVASAGVPTPELVAYDATGRLSSVPYMVLRRVHGTTMAACASDPTRWSRALESLGGILATLHRIRLGGEEGLDAVPMPFSFSSSELLDELIGAGEIGRDQRDWLHDRFEVLRPGGPIPTDPVLVHRDVIPSNVMVDEQGRVTALLDWGSAEWGSPARDLVGMPIRSLAALLRGYRTALQDASPGARVDTDLERDALWFHLYLALARLLKKPSTSDDRNWAAPRSASLVDLLAFASDAVGHR